jgi:hypothetical protein
MAYATLIEFDIDLDTHLKIGEVVGDAAVSGLIFHGGGPSERGVHSLDVWESKEDSERFYVERMVPALKQLGLEGGPPLSYQEFELPHTMQTETSPTSA